MAWLRSTTLLVAILCVSTSRVTPVEKVIGLLTDLQNNIQSEGKFEAASYNTFACFCKDSTKTKSDSITSGRDNIDGLSADIEEKTAQTANKESQLQDKKKEEEETKRSFEESKARCAKEKDEYLAADADLTKAISGMTGAIDAMVKTGGNAPTLVSVKQQVRKSLELAEAMKLVDSGAHWQMTSLLEVDPSDPQYKYHSQHIIQILSKLMADFKSKKQEADAEWEKTSTACTDEQNALEGDLTRLSGEISNLNADIAGLKQGTAQARENLVTAEGLLKDDQLYLKDLTNLCELRAKEWDQRTQMRSDELTAIADALALLQGTGQAKDALVNARAFLQTHAAQAPVVGRAVSPSFLQQRLRRSAASQQHLQEKALALLRSEGKRLNSATLSHLADQSVSDPFEKVKQLIQQLVERLIDESTQEATKKGFCDESVARAKQDRTFRYEEVVKLNGELAQLEAKEKELSMEIDDLKGAVEDLSGSLGDATTARSTEKGENLQTLKDADEGLKAINEAIALLKLFYSQAAKVSLAQTSKASPIEEDNPGAGFAGNYRGKQDASKGIIGLLEVIRTDFERTLRKTEAAEKQAAAAFVDYDRATRSDISGKSTKETLDEEDLTTTRTTIKTKMEELRTNMDLVDKANKELEALKAMCIDTGMSYADRVSKREEEVAALKRALCIIDPEGKEASCSTD